MKLPDFDSRRISSSAEFELVEDRQRDRFTIMYIFLIWMLLQLPIYMVINYWCGSSTTIWTLGIWAIPLSLSYVLARWFRSAALGGMWITFSGFCLCIVNGFYTGGLTAPAIQWTPIFAVLATMVAGPRTGILMAIISVVTYTVFFNYQKSGGSFIQEFNDNMLPVARFTGLAGISFFALGLGVLTEHMRNRYLRKIESKNNELHEALQKMRVLQGMIPICAWCKKIRNDRGYWDQVENYIKEHSMAEFEESLCPNCKDQVKSV